MSRIPLLLAIALAPAVARADNSNFRPYVVGARAAGMGGAFTALADDGTGPYYNPGGIAFAKRSSLSLSASVYGLVTGSEANVLGAGHNFKYSDLNTFPVSTAIVRKFGSRKTPDGSPASSLGFEVIVPDAFQIDDRDKLGSRQNAFFLSDVSQTVWGGITYARRIGRLGIGASAFALLGSEIESLDLTAAPDANNFATITSRTDISTKGAVAALGLRFDATDHLSLGLSAYSPEIGWGTRREFIRVTAGTTSPTPAGQIATVVADHLHASPNLPVRVQGGLAWRGKTWTLAADAIFLGPRSVHDDAGRAMDGLDRRVVRHAVVDGAIGGELLIAGSVPLRAGVFTDFAQAGDPVSHPVGTPDPNPSNATHVDRYGATLSIGYRTKHTATNVGAIVSYGTGHDDAPKNLDFTNLQPTPVTQLYMYAFVASSYRF